MELYIYTVAYIAALVSLGEPNLLSITNQMTILLEYINLLSGHTPDLALATLLYLCVINKLMALML